MRELLDEIETRQRLIREAAAQLREQINQLTGQLAAAERTLDRLKITHETVLEPASEDGTDRPESLPPGYPGRGAQPALTYRCGISAAHGGRSGT